MRCRVMMKHSGQLEAIPTAGDALICRQSMCLSFARVSRHVLCRHAFGLFALSRALHHVGWLAVSNLFRLPTSCLFCEVCQDSLCSWTNVFLNELWFLYD